MNHTKILYNAEKFMSFKLLKSELRYCNPFWNGSVTVKKTGCHGNVPLGSQSDIPG